MNRTRRVALLAAVIGGSGSAPPVLVTISGTVTDGVTPVSGVLMTFGAYSALTAANGTYTITAVPVGTTANLTPTKTSYIFDPASRSLTTDEVLGNLTGQDFIPFLPLLFDTFTTADAAPLTDPRTAEPGPGTIDFTDAGSVFSISGGLLVVNGTTSGGNSGFIQNDAVSRVAGRSMAWFWGTITNSGLARMGAASVIGSGATYQFRPATTTQNVYDGGVSQYAAPLTPPGTVTIVERTTGAFFIVGARLVYVWSAAVDALKPMMWMGTGQTPNLTFQELYTVDLVSMNADSKVYTYFDATPTSNDTFTMEANGFVEFTWTPVALETLTLMFRRTDDDNTLKLVCIQADSTVKAYRRTAGVDTELTGAISTAQTWTAGTPYRICIFPYATGINVNVANVVKYSDSFTGTSVQQTATGGKVTGFATASNLYAWKTNLTSLLPGFLQPVIPARYYLVIGDSKSVNNAWQNTFETLVNTPAAKWQRVANIATAGWSVYVVKQAIDAALAALPASPAPEFLCLNLGANDVNGDSPNDVFYLDANQDGAEWTANLAYILDAVRTKWASCQCYVMRPWKPDSPPEAPVDFQTKLSLIDDTLIQAAISGRAWAHLGADESVFLENGDGGSTYINMAPGDYIHPNAAGYALTAAQWKTTLGL